MCSAFGLLQEWWVLAQSRTPPMPKDHVMVPKLIKSTQRCHITFRGWCLQLCVLCALPVRSWWVRLSSRPKASEPFLGSAIVRVCVCVCPPPFVRSLSNGWVSSLLEKGQIELELLRKGSARNKAYQTPDSACECWRS